MDDPDKDDIRSNAAVRDLKAHPDWVAQAAIKRNGVIDQLDQAIITALAVERDMNAGMVALTAFGRNARGLDVPVSEAKDNQVKGQGEFVVWWRTQQ
ncbi:hypothetical protein ACCS93_39100 [Rhizobium ruizarguesonis]